MWKSIALAAALAVAGSAHAQTKSELVQKAVQLQLQGAEGVGRAIALQTANQLLQAVIPALQAAPADKREAAAKDIQAEVRKFHDEIEPTLRKRAAELAPSTLGAILDSRFSEDELKTIIAWMESPVSKKFEQATPEMQQALTQKLVTETKSTVDPRIKTLEGKIRKRLETAGVSLPPSASAPKK
ncbi:DUF2059 domain-containing protein [Azohydromonas caseinilytica]|uniref:DUF2059 domain-containing protein n=1 Tax=Azohydromonas caseinilytica TaxID=2728836 RepID=A0A848F7F0_9BURK|nr:DUF2059 domain-containing protein [Azohydromonas caseinilytica]NML14180.1 DUF2059 domain-containing protein [Azohydromonas caseinilytica]